MMQHLEKATYRPIATTKSFWIAMFQCSIVVLNKLKLILKLEVATLNEEIWHLFYTVLLQISSATLCQKLFKLVFISNCYHESHRGERFWNAVYVFIALRYNSAYMCVGSDNAINKWITDALNLCVRISCRSRCRFHRLLIRSLSPEQNRSPWCWLVAEDTSNDCSDALWNLPICHCASVSRYFIASRLLRVTNCIIDTD